jgi:hypothetical protein
MWNALPPPPIVVNEAIARMEKAGRYGENCPRRQLLEVMRHTPANRKKYRLRE